MSEPAGPTIEMLAMPDPRPSFADFQRDMAAIVIRQYGIPRAVIQQMADEDSRRREFRRRPLINPLLPAPTPAAEPGQVEAGAALTRPPSGATLSRQAGEGTPSWPVLGPGAL